MYTNAAANVDHAIGTVIGNVREARKKEPGVVVIADHGESLFDEGFLGHGYGLNDVQTRVPLVVANLPMALPDPFAQADLRGALLAAMTSEPGSDAPSSVARAGGAPIFQYLGTLTRPSQVAFLESGGRFIYDFRSGRVQAGGGWLRPDELPKSEHDRFVELIRYWERIQLVRARSWGA
jgi:arylsulfatase A-like enzyme